ncbi:hypothetical protein LBMAG53_26470 [Planctomycetota bacterium]|nr:hypothetical protein LBMAG53_26470 [Planctomycetota bacterium]
MNLVYAGNPLGGSAGPVRAEDREIGCESVHLEEHGTGSFGGVTAPWRFVCWLVQPQAARKFLEMIKAVADPS